VQDGLVARDKRAGALAARGGTMVSQQGSPTDVASLLERGLAFVGSNQLDQAVACWREVLRIEPENAAAIDYLRSAGVTHGPAPTGPSSTEAPPSLEGVQQQVVQLMRERRYDEALTWLYAERDRRPNDRSISRSIQLVREKVSWDCARRLGHMDQIPELALSAEELSKLGATRDELYLVKRIDGICTLDDLVQVSQLGAFGTLRCLVSLVDRQWIRLRPPPVHGQTPAPVAGVTAPSAPASTSSTTSGPRARSTLGPPPRTPSESGVIVRFPTAQGAEAKAPVVEKRRVLIIDGDPTQGEFSRFLLSGSGGLSEETHHYVSENSGPSGLTSALAHPPALVLADFSLPGFDAAELVRRMREHPMTLRVPVILVVNRLELGFLSSRLAGQQVSFVVKPVEKSELLAAARAALPPERT
jgi:CheY-like chemotaxis protein